MKTLKLSNLKFLNLLFVLILFIFGRVFMGLNVFTLRLGEILIGISAVFFIYFLVTIINLSSSNKVSGFISIITNNNSISFSSFTHFLYRKKPWRFKNNRRFQSNLSSTLSFKKFINKW